MPNRNKHCLHQWDELNERFTLKKFEDKYEPYRYYMSGGAPIITELPVIVHICKKCGEIKLFSAKVRRDFHNEYREEKIRELLS